MPPVSVNLLTKEFISARNSLIASSVSLLSLLLMLVVLGTGAWQYVSLYRINSDLQTAKAELNSRQPELVQLQRVKNMDDKIQQTASKVKKIKSKALNCTYLLALVHAKIPAGVILSQQTIKEKGITLQLEAGSLEDIGKLADSLRGESMFTNVDIQSITSDGKSFKSTVQINFGGGGQKK